jgi:hypothetical protein
VPKKMQVIPANPRMSPARAARWPTRYANMPRKKIPSTIPVAKAAIPRTLLTIEDFNPWPAIPTTI